MGRVKGWVRRGGDAGKAFEQRGRGGVEVLIGDAVDAAIVDGAKGVAGLRGIRIDSDQATLLAPLLLELHDISVEAPPED